MSRYNILQSWTKFCADKVLKITLNFQLSEIALHFPYRIFLKFTEVYKHLNLLLGVFLAGCYHCYANLSGYLENHILPVKA